MSEDIPEAEYQTRLYNMVQVILTEIHHKDDDPTIKWQGAVEAKSGRMDSFIVSSTKRVRIIQIIRDNATGAIQYGSGLVTHNGVLDPGNDG